MSGTCSGVGGGGAFACTGGGTFVCGVSELDDVAIGGICSARHLIAFSICSTGTLTFSPDLNENSGMVKMSTVM